MRKLMWFTLGFAAGCGLCAYALPKEWMLPALFLLLALFLLSLLFTAKPVRAAGLAVLGCAVSMGWFGLFYQQYLIHAVAMDGREAQAVITVTDYSYETGYGIGVDGKLKLAGKTYQVRAYLDAQEPLSPGDMVAGTFRFRVTTGDGKEKATSHPGKGIFLLAYQQDEAVTERSEVSPSWAFPARARREITAILENAFPEDTAAFAKALLLGDTTGLSYETDTALKVSGIRHVAAVSGLHISILFALISAVTFKRRYLTALLGIPVLALFAAVAGFTPSVVRACIMSGLMVLSAVIDREYDGPTALSFAVLVMLIVNPLAVTSVSLQLSAASVAGIFCFREPVNSWILSLFGTQKGRGWRVRLLRSAASSVAITLSAMVFTTPLCAYYFGMVSLISPVTNLLTLWVISLIFYGIMAVVGLHFVWQAGAAMLAKLIAIPIRYVLLTAKAMASFPLAAVYTNNFYIVLWLLFCYVLLVVFLLQRNRRPLELICYGCMGLCLALLMGWWEPAQDDTRATVLDVGQGQAILLQSEGRTYLVDCGGDRDGETADIVASHLLSQGIDSLDGVILTHYDRDHAGALENLLTRIPTDMLVLPYTVNMRGYLQTDAPVFYVEDALDITFGAAEISVFGPIYSGDDNENSMCVLFEAENCVILITGDRSAFGERMLLRQTELPDVNMLVAGHHGSKYSTSEELLAAVRPETVIISVGADNSYGHPAPELLSRLAEFGCEVYRTDIHGTIVYRR